MTREELQKQAVELVKNNNTVILEWTTGCGKSKAAIDIMNYLCDNSNRRLDVLLVVAETAHKENWLKEFSKFGITTCNLCIECYASLKKYKNTSWDLVICDEVHHINSDLRMEVLNSMSIHTFIGLSATIPSETFLAIGELRGRLSMSNMTLKEAIKLGILPEPKVYLIPLTLNNTDEDCIVVEEWGTKSSRKTIKCKLHERWNYIKHKSKYPHTRLEMSCTQQQKYDYINTQYDYFQKMFFRTNNIAMKNKWLFLGNERKRFLGEAKTNYAKYLLNKISKRRYICFCSSIAQAEYLGGSNCIHSKKKNSLSIIEDFNNGNINNIFAIGMLQEGQNLNNIEAGVIIQLDGTDRAFYQKFGRVLRASNPIQYIFYYENTRDTEYLNNVIEGVDPEYIYKINNLKSFI